MVGKLMKHELIALFRVLIYIAAIVLVLAVLTRIGMAVNSGEFFGISLAFYIIGVCILSACALIASIQRFWSSFFTGEGYMTFSLPATPAQILIAKMLSALIVMFFSDIVAIGTLAIVGSGLPAEFWAGMNQIFGEVFEMIGSYISSEPLVIVEAVLLVLCSIPMSLLFFYTVMSVGQLLTKGRKGLTFVIFIGAYWVLSLLEMLILTPILVNLEMKFGFHAYLCTQIGIYLALDIAMFFTVRYILMHKVNLII